MSLLANISSPADIRGLDNSQMQKLAEEIRREIIETVAKNGGHLAPNLGVVELTLALHSVFETPRDKIVWDVGHQCYVHKLLTGRRAKFGTLRKYNGLSGFPRPEECPHDSFATGHSSTSISAATGMALARDLKGEHHSVVAVIGDGAMTGGMAFEALNHAGHLKKDMIVVLNDNEMSIAENVGGMARYLGRLRTDPKYSRGKEEIEQILKKIPSIGPTVLKFADRLKDSFKYLVVPGMFFEELGFVYLGPIDGHNVQDMIKVLRQAKSIKEPVIVHVITKKGLGYAPAEKNPDKFHGIGPFDIKTGETVKNTIKPSYTEVFGNTAVKLAARDDSIVAITAAMPGGTGLNLFAKAFPHRFFDVGIAEQHAVTMSAGLAASGLKPLLAIYSTFLQRAYDQLLHDVCLQSLPVTLAIDRAGLVGDDGPTHHGLFDLSYLRQMPNMVVMAPRDENMLQHMLHTALEYPGPAALRYPRGIATGCPLDAEPLSIPIGKAEVLREGRDITLLAIGTTVEIAYNAATALAAEGVSATVVDARFIKPLDEECIINQILQTRTVITLEENVLSGGFGSAVMELLNARGIFGIKILSIGFPDSFVEHGDKNLLLARYGLTVDNVCSSVLTMLGARRKGKKMPAARSS
ncbi:MAG: 1-deoxy-D-xylulose-5-phosphate synthase [Peptococcaceae bacterium BRH_c4b]|nr:MAG: 1-deoxy-D-xylulose-5-phosphate synthase [Peptococcaceae bacterium BRH_c4b]